MKYSNFLLISILLLGALVFYMPVSRLFYQIVRMASTTNTSAGLYSMAFITAPNMETARTLAKGAVEKKLVACVNIIPQITSVYEWEGKIEEDAEILLMMKTRTSVVPDLSRYVRENHPYDVAEVISSKIDDGNAPYLDWIGRIVPEPKSSK